MKIILTALFSILLFKTEAQFGQINKNTTTKELILNTVVLDAGHGGKDFGCHGNYAQEKDITLTITLKLGELMAKYMPETKVIYTRKVDKTLNLCDRAVAANAIQSDLFISIHCNAAASPQNTRARGVEIYIQDITLTQEEITKAKAIGHGNFIDVETSNCPTNDKTPYKMILAATAAVKISNSLVSVGFESKGVKRANFMVLRKTKMPSILIEVGFLTNPDEENFLASEYGQLVVATAILKGLMEIK